MTAHGEQLNSKKQPRQLHFTDDQRIVHFLLSTNSPFSIVDNDEFHDVCAITTRTRNTYAHAILPRVTLGLRDEMKKLLQRQVCVSLQTDSWVNSFNTAAAQGLFGVFSHILFVSN
jgi:hypothetical protein